MSVSKGEHLRLTQGEVIHGKYEIIEEVGCGNFSKVYRCYDLSKPSKGRKSPCFALKILKKEYRSDATFERRMLRILKEHDPQGLHKVIRMHEYFDHKDCPVFIMPIHGPSLRARRLGVGRGVVTKDILYAFSYELLKTLDYIHYTCRMVHTDLKPENILLESIHTKERSLGNSWVICDFGSASLWRKDKMDSDLISTRPYRAPEVVLGNKWHYAADMWSVGCILYEVAMGHRLFEVRDDNTHLQLMEKRLGKLPEVYTRRSRYSGKYFNSRGEFSVVAESIRQGKCRFTSIKDTFRDDPPFYRMLASLLVYDPSKRATAYDALQRSVFDDIRRAEEEAYAKNNADSLPDVFIDVNDSTAMTDECSNTNIINTSTNNNTSMLSASKTDDSLLFSNAGGEEGDAAANQNTVMPKKFVSENQSSSLIPSVESNDTSHVQLHAAQNSKNASKGGTPSLSVCGSPREHTSSSSLNQRLKTSSSSAAAQPSRKTHSSTRVKQQQQQSTSIPGYMSSKVSTRAYPSSKYHGTTGNGSSSKSKRTSSSGANVRRSSSASGKNASSSGSVHDAEAAAVAAEPVVKKDADHIKPSSAAAMEDKCSGSLATNPLGDARKDLPPLAAAAAAPAGEAVADGPTFSPKALQTRMSSRTVTQAVAQRDDGAAGKRRPAELSGSSKQQRSHHADPSAMAPAEADGRVNTGLPAPASITTSAARAHNTSMMYASPSACSTASEVSPGFNVYTTPVRDREPASDTTTTTTPLSRLVTPLESSTASPNIESSSSPKSRHLTGNNNNSDAVVSHWCRQQSNLNLKAPPQRTGVLPHSKISHARSASSPIEASSGTPSPSPVTSAEAAIRADRKANTQGGPFVVCKAYSRTNSNKQSLTSPASAVGVEGVDERTSKSSSTYPTDKEDAPQQQQPQQQQQQVLPRRSLAPTTMVVKRNKISPLSTVAAARPAPVPAAAAAASSPSSAAGGSNKAQDFASPLPQHHAPRRASAACLDYAAISSNYTKVGGVLKSPRAGASNSSAFRVSSSSSLASSIQLDNTNNSNNSNTINGNTRSTPLMSPVIMTRPPQSRSTGAGLVDRTKRPTVDSDTADSSLNNSRVLKRDARTLQRVLSPPTAAEEAEAEGAASSTDNIVRVPPPPDLKALRKGER